MRATKSSKGSSVTLVQKDQCMTGRNARSAEKHTPPASTTASYQRSRKASRLSEVVKRRVRRVEIRIASPIATSSNDDVNEIGQRVSETVDQASSRKCRVYAAQASCQARKYGCRLCSCKYVNSKKSRQATRPGKIAVLMRILIVV